jgi:hypothetical protein
LPLLLTGVSLCNKQGKKLLYAELAHLRRRNKSTSNETSGGTNPSTDSRSTHMALADSSTSTTPNNTTSNGASNKGYEFIPTPSRLGQGDLSLLCLSVLQSFLIYMFIAHTIFLPFLSILLFSLKNLLYAWLFHLRRNSETSSETSSGTNPSTGSHSTHIPLADSSTSTEPSNTTTNGTRRNGEGSITPTPSHLGEGDLSFLCLNVLQSFLIYVFIVHSIFLLFLSILLFSLLLTQTSQDDALHSNRCIRGRHRIRVVFWTQTYRRQAERTHDDRYVSETVAHFTTELGEAP